MRQAGTEKHTMCVAMMSPLLFKIRIINSISLPGGHHLHSSMHRPVITVFIFVILRWILVNNFALQPSVVSHGYNPSTWEAAVGGALT